MRVMQTLADATNVIAEGEVLQLLNCRDASVDAANYMRVIHCKTAKLFEAAMRLGALGRRLAHDDEVLAFAATCRLCGSWAEQSVCLRRQ